MSFGAARLAAERPLLRGWPRLLPAGGPTQEGAELTDGSAYDHPFWRLDVLLSWTRERAGISGADEPAIQAHREAVLREISIMRAPAGELSISGLRCRLEFPDNVKTIGAHREAISTAELADSTIWTLLGQYVLTPQVSSGFTPEGRALLTSMPVAERAQFNKLVAAFYPFRWAEPGDVISRGGATCWCPALTCSEYGVVRPERANLFGPNCPAPSGDEGRKSKSGMQLNNTSEAKLMWAAP
jgi:hypothetical protein